MHFVAKSDGDRVALGFERHSCRVQHGAEEAGDVFTPTYRGSHAFELCRDGPRASVCWAKRERLPLSVVGVIPLSVDGFLLRPQFVDEIQAQLMRMPAGRFSEQGTLEKSLGDLLAGARHGNGDAEVGLDALVFAYKHIQDHAVDGVVRPIVGDDAHLTLLLVEAVYSALPLLMARRVPSQVVVQNGVEVFLQIDALGKAVSADQHIFTGLVDECGNARLALSRRSNPVIDSTRTLTGSDPRSPRAT